MRKGENAGFAWLFLFLLFFLELFIVDYFKDSPQEEEINSLCEASAHIPSAVTKHVPAPSPTDLLEFSSRIQTFSTLSVSHTVRFSQTELADSQHALWSGVRPGFRAAPPWASHSVTVYPVPRPSAPTVYCALERDLGYLLHRTEVAPLSIAFKVNACVPHQRDPRESPLAPSAP